MPRHGDRAYPVCTKEVRVDLLRILAAPEVPTNELNPEQLDLDLEPRLPKRVFAAEAIEQENEEAADLAWSERVLFRGDM